MSSVDSHDYFEQVSKDWDEMRTGFFADSVRVTALDTLNVAPRSLAVDLGAGTGFLTQALIARGVSVIAVDQSLAMLEELRRKFGAGDVECRLGRAEALPIDDASVDYVLANMYLHHVDDPAQAISEAVRILRPGGAIAITDLDEHDFAFLRVEHHDRWLGFTHEDIERWISSSGLEAVNVSSIGTTCQAESSDGSDRASIGIFLATGRKPL
jgi:ubiquinone/menaquinone biosynthesis C-methylase UbiE